MCKKEEYILARKKVGAILLAGGYGNGINGHQRSKLLEPLTENGRPIVAHAYSLLDLGLNIVPTYTVVNCFYAENIAAVLPKPPEPNPSYLVLQNRRVGTAGGVQLCIPYLLQDGMEHVLVIYADMPLWRPETIANLLWRHLISKKKPVISMFSITLNDHCPGPITRYGRIIKNSSGRIVGICEPEETEDQVLINASSVNPSAWVFNLDWLRRNICDLPWHKKEDGFQPEQRLPDLVSLAAKQDCSVNEVVLDDPNEALGVNNNEDLVLARAEFAKRIQV